LARNHDRRLYIPSIQQTDSAFHLPAGLIAVRICGYLFSAKIHCQPALAGCPDPSDESAPSLDGNRADVATTEEMVLIMESKYGKANRIWGMDRGMVSEENIEFMQERGAPSKELKVLLQRMKILLPNRAKIIENAVKKILPLQA